MGKVFEKLVTVRLSAEHLKAVEVVMKRHRLNQTDSVRCLMGLGIDLYSDLGRLGIPQTIALFDGVKGKLSPSEDLENGGLKT